MTLYHCHVGNNTLSFLFFVVIADILIVRRTEEKNSSKIMSGSTSVELDWKRRNIREMENDKAITFLSVSLSATLVSY